MVAYRVIFNGELKHHGVLGMKWGVRRYQNEDGTLTPEGREHYGRVSEKGIFKFQREDAKRKIQNDKFLRQKKKEVKDFLERDYKYRKDFLAVSKMPETTKEERDAKIKAQDKFFDDFQKVQDANEVYALKSNKSSRDEQYLIDKYGEKRLSELADYEGSDDYNIVNEAIYKFQSRVGEESGDWYNGLGVSDNFKNNVNKKHELMNKANSIEAEINKEVERKYPVSHDPKSYNPKTFVERTKYRDELTNNRKDLASLKEQARKLDEKTTSIVLRDLGYIPTKKAIKAVDPLIRWD